MRPPFRSFLSLALAALALSITPQFDSQANAGNTSSETFLPSRTISLQDGSLNQDTPLSSLIDREGNLYLFRVIGGKYVPGHRSGVFSSREGAYSYSLTPYIVDHWAFRPDQITNSIIVSVQNIYEDRLTFPSLKILQGESGLVSSFSQESLTPDTYILEIAHFNEVKVPFDRESPLGTLTADDFRSILHSFADGRGEDVIDLDAFVEAVLSSPGFEPIP